VTLEIGYHPAAAAELVRAAAWYENETAGLGDRFLDAIEAAVLRGGRWPNVGKPVVITPDGAVVNRKLPVGGFPWAIGYEVTDETLLVLAAFHQHREPEYWIDRTSD
jgi:plasmid stabilization system protein ParE